MIAGVLALIGGFALVVVRVGLLPLDRMGHTAAAIAGGDLSHRVETTDPRTEVGRLGAALNRMLDRLEDAFAAREASQERLRRFIADASHELRTPLVSIRGYAELYRMGAARDEEDVAKAMRRIEDEAARMGVLVEDLLTLARLDEVRAAPHGPVDLAQLARDAVDDARVDRARPRDHAARRRRARVTGDADQLRQVLVNLLRNALVHTPGGHADRGHRRRLGRRSTVRDHGPGLPGDDPDALFERFWRSEGGRERGKGGAGLGLAIVAGIVDAHGGTVSAANAPDGGATFEVRFPRAEPKGAWPFLCSLRALPGVSKGSCRSWGCDPTRPGACPPPPPPSSCCPTACSSSATGRCCSPIARCGRIAGEDLVGHAPPALDARERAGRGAGRRALGVRHRRAVRDHRWALRGRGDGAGRRRAFGAGPPRLARRVDGGS